MAATLAPRAGGVLERHVLVASKNPAKISAARQAVQSCFPHAKIEVHAVESASGVRDQPLGEQETLRGALNRIQSAQDAFVLEQQQQQRWPLNSLLISMEGGLLQRKHRQLRCFAWVAVKQASSGRISTARSAEFLLPAELSRLVLDGGLELGEADDRLFGRSQSGRGGGTVGHLTNGLIPRSLYYEHALVMALIPFMQPQWYTEFGGC